MEQEAAKDFFFFPPCKRQLLRGKSSKQEKWGIENSLCSSLGSSAACTTLIFGFHSKPRENWALFSSNKPQCGAVKSWVSLEIIRIFRLGFCFLLKKFCEFPKSWFWGEILEFTPTWGGEKKKSMGAWFELCFTGIPLCLFGQAGKQTLICDNSRDLGDPAALGIPNIPKRKKIKRHLDGNFDTLFIKTVQVSLYRYFVWFFGGFYLVWGGIFGLGFWFGLDFFFFFLFVGFFKLVFFGGGFGPGFGFDFWGFFLRVGIYFGPVFHRGWVFCYWVFWALRVFCLFGVFCFGFILLGGLEFWRIFWGVEFFRKLRDF